MKITDWLQGISILVLLFYAWKTSQMAKETRKMAEATKAMADSAREERELQKMKAAVIKVFTGPSGEMKTVKKIGEEAGLKPEEVSLVIPELAGPNGLLKIGGKHPEEGWAYRINI